MAGRSSAEKPGSKRTSSLRVKYPSPSESAVENLSLNMGSKSASPRGTQAATNSVQSICPSLFKSMAFAAASAMSFCAPAIFNAFDTSETSRKPEPARSNERKTECIVGSWFDGHLRATRIASVLYRILRSWEVPNLIMSFVTFGVDWAIVRTPPPTAALRKPLTTQVLAAGRSRRSLSSIEAQSARPSPGMCFQSAQRQAGPFSQKTVAWRMKSWRVPDSCKPMGLICKVANSQKTMPQLKMSAAGVTSPCQISGDIVEGVPPGNSRFESPGLKSCAKPRSMSITWGMLWSSTLARRS
mmetsp:Transcript_97218/g.280551  ORF Transcript_97218/g.280551 Transcript_97218/m.280551 type:complete len:299 (+) Transcript_97218:255-1151(+)